MVPVELITPISFNDLPDGVYIYIRNNSHDEVLFQKIGDNQALLRSTIGTAQWQAAVNAGQSYAGYFPVTAVESSHLPTYNEASGITDTTILDIDNNWWTSSSAHSNQKYYVTADGTISTAKFDLSYHIRPLLIINGDLFVTGGDGTTPANAYKLVVP
jgi:hypothetical protein